VSEYATLLENNGFEVRFMTLFDRPTGLADGEAGLRNWIAMFGADYLSKVGTGTREAFFLKVEELLRPGSFRDGQWWADYRRLRFVACKWTTYLPVVPIRVPRGELNHRRPRSGSARKTSM
jgi:hypothetical protein